MRTKTLLLGILSIVITGCASAPNPVTEITVVMNEFSYNPAPRTLPAGQQIVLTLRNDGKIEHDFVVDPIDVSLVSAEGGVGGHHMSGDHSEFDLHISTLAGGVSILKFTAQQPGTYRIFCSVEGHEEAGMVAELIVVSE